MSSMIRHKANLAFRYADIAPYSASLAFRYVDISPLIFHTYSRAFAGCQRCPVAQDELKQNERKEGLSISHGDDSLERAGEKEQTTNWSELLPRDKIRLIIEDVMGWTCFMSWDGFQAALHHGGERQALNYPVATWNTHLGYERWTVIQRDGESAATFDPLDSLDDAWLVAESPRFRMVQLSRFAVGHPQFMYSCSITDGGNGEAQSFAATATESICISALTLIGTLDQAGSVRTGKA